MVQTENNVLTVDTQTRRLYGLGEVMNPLHKQIIEIGDDQFTRYDCRGTAREFTNGAKIDDYFTQDGSRYTFDKMLSSKDGWRQFDTDQDAWYFGVWYNMDKKMTVTYAEGDVHVKYDIPDMDVEYNEMCKFYGKAPAWCTTIDEDGTVTKHYSR